MTELYGDEWKELVATPPSVGADSSRPVSPDSLRNAPAAGGRRPDAHRMTPSTTSIGLGSPSSHADVRAEPTTGRQLVRHPSDDNASAFSEGSWRGMNDTDLWQMVCAPFDAEVDDISHYERRLLRAQALLQVRGRVEDTDRLRGDLKVRMVRAQYQDKYHKLGALADETMRQDLADCMEADDDDALAQDRAELILDLVQERGGLTVSAVRDAVRSPVKEIDKHQDERPRATMAAAPLIRKTLFASQDDEERPEPAVGPGSISSSSKAP